MASVDWSECPAVERDPRKLGGDVVLRGTRMPVWGIFENLEGGLTVDEIAEHFQLPKEQIITILEFAAQSTRADHRPAA